MDNRIAYRNLIERHLGELSELSNRCPTPGVDSVCAFDEERDQYLLLSVGWAGDQPMGGTILHVRILNGKIWIEEDWTEDGLASRLLQDGVPKGDIVLGFHAPSMRTLTPFAVA